MSRSVSMRRSVMSVSHLTSRRSVVQFSVKRPLPAAAAGLAPRARHFASLGDFELRAAHYWTADRVNHLTNGKDHPLSPDKPGVASLFRVLGLLNADAMLGENSVKKYKQLNAMYTAMEHTLAEELQQPVSGPLRLVDMCTGSSSHLALLLAFAARYRWERPVHVLAVDASSARLASAEHRANLLGFGSDTLRFHASNIRDLPTWPELYSAAYPAGARAAAASAPAGSSSAGSSASTAEAAAVLAPHGIFALHACDTATDEAAAYAIRANAAALLVAPCCQSELAASWKAASVATQTLGKGYEARRKRRHEERLARDTAAAHGASTVDRFHAAGHAFGAVHRMPNLRREMASTVTDTLRMLLLRASGYAVSVTEFVSTEHTPKNRESWCGASIPCCCC